MGVGERSEDDDEFWHDDNPFESWLEDQVDK
jgi:hypothetical protein